MGHAEGAFGQEPAENIGQPESQEKGVCRRTEHIGYEQIARKAEQARNQRTCRQGDGVLHVVRWHLRRP
jgi:hypothetical protein